MNNQNHICKSQPSCTSCNFVQNTIIPLLSTREYVERIELLSTNRGITYCIEVSDDMPCKMFQSLLEMITKQIILQEAKNAYRFNTSATKLHRSVSLQTCQQIHIIPVICYKNTNTDSQATQQKTKMLIPDEDGVGWKVIDVEDVNHLVSILGV
jgi:hypothetical protein